MGRRHTGISYKPEELTERHLRSWSGVTVEYVRVPPIAHEFVHESTDHLLMFTTRGTRADGESHADGERVSTLRDTSRTFSILPAGCHYEGWTLPTLPAEYLSVAIAPDSPLFDGAHGVAELCRQAQVYVPNRVPELTSTLEKLAGVIRSSSPADALYGQTLLQLLVLELSRAQGKDTADGLRRGGLAPWQERRAKELMMADLSTELTLDRIAEACGLSVSHFSRAFRTTVGQPPHSWLLDQRIDRAKDLLLCSDMSLAEVAVVTGFRDQSHFTRMFGSRAGSSPGAWRRQMRF